MSEPPLSEPSATAPSGHPFTRIRTTTSTVEHQLGALRLVHDRRSGRPAPLSARIHRAALAAQDRGGVLSRTELTGLGLSRNVVAAQVAAGRWRLHGRWTVALHTGELNTTAQHWRALWESGIGVAVVDGTSALIAAGLTGWADREIHVSALHQRRVPSVPGVRAHLVRLRLPGEVMPAGLPRTRPEIAAVRAAHWAVSDRQAATVLAMVIQQRLTTSTRLQHASHHVGGRTRRAFITQVVQDITNGAHSLGELDFAAMCRKHKVPPPERQVLRRTSRGRVYLDARWRNGLVVEIDGSGHRSGLALTDDNLRQNELVLGHDRVLRFDLLALRVRPQEVMAQIARGVALP